MVLLCLQKFVRFLPWAECLLLFLILMEKLLLIMLSVLFYLMIEYQLLPELYRLLFLVRRIQTISNVHFTLYGRRARG